MDSVPEEPKETPEETKKDSKDTYEDTIRFLMTDPQTGKKMSYEESRMMYG